MLKEQELQFMELQDDLTLILQRFPNEDKVLEIYRDFRNLKAERIRILKEATLGQTQEHGDRIRSLQQSIKSLML